MSTPAPEVSRQLTPVDDAVKHINHEGFKKQIATALPPGIDPDRFVRVVTTALRQNPKLADCDRQSLYTSAIRAAQDGLVPDGREGAFVEFKKKVDDRWVPAVQWMPMVGGIIKRLAGAEIAIDSQVVYENDEFDQTLGDDARIHHKAPKLGEKRGKPIGAYAIARTATGMVFREVMDVDQINQVRDASKAKDGGPWTTWWTEMARKTVIRRLSKRLPITDPKVADVIHRDDELYEFDRKTGETAGPRTATAAKVNEALRSRAASEPIEGEFIEAGSTAEDTDF